MKKIIAALIFSLVCLHAVAASSADWLVISETRFLYLPSIKRTGETKTT